MKIALGTAQWGANYGISNKNGVPTDNELDKIISLACASGIDLLDTASVYGNAEQRLGNFTNKEFNIITKVGNINSENTIKQQLSKSLKNLKEESIYGCLFHNINELITTPLLWAELVSEKKAGNIKKIGCSLYYPYEIEFLLKNSFIPDIVQLPYSILDQKFSTHFKKLKNKGVEIHVRSIFLQGIYFMKPNTIPKKLRALKGAIDKIQKICKKHSISILDLCIQFILRNPIIDSLIIGVESKNQLQEIISAISSEVKEEVFLQINMVQLKEKKMLNPSNWK